MLWFWIVPFVALVLTFTLVPVGWLPPVMSALVYQVRDRLGIKVPQPMPSDPVGQGRDVLRLGGGPQVADPPREVPSKPVIGRCIINGRVVEITSGYCPPSTAPAAVAPPPPLPVIRPVEAQENPFLKPGTIYRCRSYSGGLFWAEAHCSQHKALIDRIASVPVGMPFQQQVNVAESGLQSAETQQRSEQNEYQRQAVCSSLRAERDQIWKRSGSGSGYVPSEQLGADRTRWRQIESQMAGNNCGS
jgi:hypothetical protein